MIAEVSTVSIGVNVSDRVATVTPSVLVVAPGSRVQFELEDQLRGRATIKVLGDCGHQLPGDPNLGPSFEVTRTGIYYVVVTMSNPGKLGVMMVIIIDP